MDIQDILKQLQSERTRLEQAIAALEALRSSARRRGRLPLSGAGAGTRRRVMSAAARRRISRAMKARWAARKGRTRASRLAKVPAKKAAARGRMSPAARKRL